MAIPVNIPGYYEILVYDNEVDKDKLLAKTTMAIITPFDFSQYTPEQSDFGISCHLTRQNTGWARDLVKEISWMGAKIIRDDLDWGICETVKGKYTIDVEPYRSMMLEENMGFLHASGLTNKFYDGNCTPYTDAGYLGAANYISGVASLFGDAYMAVDVFNEYWLPRFGDIGGITGSKPEYYVPLQKKVYEVVKHEHPEITVLANFADNDGRFKGWYEGTLALGVKDYMDGIYPHMYYQDAPPEVVIPSNMEFIKQMHTKYNVAGKEIWVTEQGATTTQVSELVQAQYVPRAYAIQKSYGVNKSIWYDFMNDGVDKEYTEDNFGFVHNLADALGAYTPKPAYVAYAVMTRLLTNASFVSGGLESNGIYLYKFDNDKGERINMIWSNADRSVDVTTNTALEVTGLMGEKTTLNPVSGKVKINSSPSVVYVKGNIDF